MKTNCSLLVHIEVKIIDRLRESCSYLYYSVSICPYNCYKFLCFSHHRITSVWHCKYFLQTKITLITKQPFIHKRCKSIWLGCGTLSECQNSLSKNSWTRQNVIGLGTKRNNNILPPNTYRYCYRFDGILWFYFGWSFGLTCTNLNHSGFYKEKMTQDSIE